MSLNTPWRFSLISALEYVLMAFVIIYSSLWSLFASAGSNTFLRLGAPLLVILIALRANALSAQRMIRVICLAAFLGIYLVATRFNSIRFILYFIIPMVLLCVYIGIMDDKEDIKGLFLKLSDIVFILSAISLFFFIFGTLLDLLPFRSTITYNWAGTNRETYTYLNLIYESQDVVFLGKEFTRNCGIFAEAPGFAVYLVVAIAAECLLRPKLRIVRCGILCLAIITTFSAKAIILAIVAIGLKYLITSGSALLSPRTKLFMMPAVLAVAFAAIFIVFNDKAESYSYLMRVDDLQASMTVFGRNPIFGAGYVNDGAISDCFRLLTRPNNGLSMGVVLLLAQGGLWLTSLYVISSVLFIFRLKGQDRLSWLCFLGVFWGLLFITNMPYSFFTMLVLACTIEGGRAKKSEMISEK